MKQLAMPRSPNSTASVCASGMLPPRGRGNFWSCRGSRPFPQGRPGCRSSTWRCRTRLLLSRPAIRARQDKPASMSRTARLAKSSRLRRLPSSSINGASSGGRPAGRGGKRRCSPGGNVNDPRYRWGWYAGRRRRRCNPGRSRARPHPAQADRRSPHRRNDGDSAGPRGACRDADPRHGSTCDGRSCRGLAPTDLAECVGRALSLPEIAALRPGLLPNFRSMRRLPPTGKRTHRRALSMLSPSRRMARRRS